MIELRGLTKNFGETIAVDGLTFEVKPGRVTGFLGPNGAGKSTTLRMLLGLDRPTAGEALIDGRRYRDLDQPLRRVGALLEADAIHPGRRARAHLAVAARTHGIPLARVNEVLDLVGLTGVARKRVKTFSLGMRQRLGIASALLGNPGVLLFDEPVNGLDAEGVRWVRGLVRGLAAEGRTVLVSSHLMTEMQMTADHLLVIGRGRLIADASTSEVLSQSGGHAVRVRTPDATGFADHLARMGAGVERVDDRSLIVRGLSAEQVGAAAFTENVAIYELSEVPSSLEQAFLELTSNSLDYVSSSSQEGSR